MKTYQTFHTFFFLKNLGKDFQNTDLANVKIEKHDVMLVEPYSKSFGAFETYTREHVEGVPFSSFLEAKEWLTDWVLKETRKLREEADRLEQLLKGVVGE